MQPAERQVRAESTGWRDKAMSERHRAWGFNCPAADLDLVMVEYNFGRPVGVIEFKHAGVDFPDLEHPTYRALTRLADASGLPFLLAFYWPSTWAFRVHPVNEHGTAHFRDGELLTEREFVQRLYKLRRLTVADELAGRLMDELPYELAS